MGMVQLGGCLALLLDIGLVLQGHWRTTGAAMFAEPIAAPVLEQPVLSQGAVLLEPATIQDVDLAEPIAVEDMDPVEPVADLDTYPLEPVSDQDAAPLEPATDEDAVPLEPVAGEFEPVTAHATELDSANAVLSLTDTHVPDEPIRHSVATKSTNTYKATWF